LLTSTLSIVWMIVKLLALAAFGNDVKQKTF
jgi:hypothetical protein